MAFLAQSVRDLRYAVRLMRRNLTWTATAIAVLAAGIGPTTAIFSVANKVLLEPLPYPESDRLVQLFVSTPMGKTTLTSVPKYNVWREGRDAFQAVTGFTSTEPMTLSNGHSQALTSGVRVSAEYFAVFGISLAAGRVMSAVEDAVRGPRVVLISDRLWQRRFARDRGVTGRMLRINDQPYEVIGVIARGAPVDPQTDLWLPLQADPESADHSSRLQVVARLRRGVTVERAHRQMYGLAGTFHRRFPHAMGPFEYFTAAPLRDMLVGDARFTLLALLGAVTLVLLIACANLANLLLARGSDRSHELSLRGALGARPGRIISQLLMESLLLSVGGTLLGFAAGYAGLRWLRRLSAGYLSLLGPAGSEISLDWRLLAFMAILVVSTTVLFGLYPAWRASRIDLSSTMRSGGSQTGTDATHRRLQSVLVVLQMAVALVLLVGAGLMIRTFIATRSVHPGFVANGVIALEMPLSGPGFAHTVDVGRLVAIAENRIGALPDVAHVAVASSLPLEPGASMPFTIDRRPLLRAPYHGTANWRRISPSYFDVFRMRLLAGRVFTRHDNGNGQPVVIINDAMARKFWPDNNPIMERVTLGQGIRAELTEPSRTIVGVVANVIEHAGLTQDPEPMAYVPIEQVTDNMNAFQNQVMPLQWVVRTNVTPMALSGSIERELRASGAGLPIGSIRSMTDIVAASRAQSDLNVALLSVFAIVATLLAAIGLHGLMAYSIRQRTREIGVRMALGASATDILRMVLIEGLHLLAAGVLVGTAAAIVLARAMAGLIYGLAAWNSLTFVAVTLVLNVVALLTILVSARQATLVKPTVALRHT